MILCIGVRVHVDFYQYGLLCTCMVYMYRSMISAWVGGSMLRCIGVRVHAGHCGC